MYTDIEDQIREAAPQAINDAGLENVTLSSVVSHQDSDKISVHFREEGGKYYRVIVDTAEVLTDFGDTGVESFRKDIARKLASRDPNDYLSKE